jgi:hypothetical protein
MGGPGLGVSMAFTKTGIAVSQPQVVQLPLPLDMPNPEIGQELNGMVWDGEKWVEKKEWLLRLNPKE